MALEFGASGGLDVLKKLEERANPQKSRSYRLCLTVSSWFKFLLISLWMVQGFFLDAYMFHVGSTWIVTVLVLKRRDVQK